MKIGLLKLKSIFHKNNLLFSFMILILIVQFSYVNIIKLIYIFDY